jgi:hypothetical protein
MNLLTVVQPHLRENRIGTIVVVLILVAILVAQRFASQPRMLWSTYFLLGTILGAHTANQTNALLANLIIFISSLSTIVH